MNFPLGQCGRSRSLQDRLYAFQPRAGMNLKALREQSDSILDVTSRPNSGNAVEPQGLIGIDAADARVGMNAAHKSGMEHVGKANIADVNAVSGKKAARLMRFDAAADEAEMSFPPLELA